MTRARGEEGLLRCTSVIISSQPAEMPANYFFQYRGHNDYVILLCGVREAMAIKEKET